MTHYRREYDFRIDGEVVGTFELSRKEDELYQRATFVADDQEVDDEYFLRLDGGEVVAFRTDADDPWISLDDYPNDAFPSAAFPLLLDKAQSKFRYRAIDESTGEVGEYRELNWRGDIIEEVRNDEVVRSFTVRNEVLVEVDWGGATSTLLD